MTANTPGDMLIFVSGSYPIYGKQILYFADPALSSRASIPPPTTFTAIEQGKVVAQRPFDKTANIISRAESIVPEGQSPMERAFFAALSRKYSTKAGDGFIEELTMENERSS